MSVSANQWQQTTEREIVIDALRGFALFGILIVNIQSFAWGVGAPTMGILWAGATLADTVTIWLTSFIFEYKIYPIFCFCFGYGFALMAKRWRLTGLDQDAVAQRFNRRITFLLILGLFHGFFIWFGDVLARYALTAYLLKKHIGKGPRSLLTPLKFWGIVTILTTLLSAILNAATVYYYKVDEAATLQTVKAMYDIFYVYAAGSYLEMLPARFADYGLVLFSWLFVFPQAMFIFILGAMVAQLGWLKNPKRHHAKWRRILWASLAVGIPISIVFAQHSVAASNNPGALPSLTLILAMGFAPLLSPAYVALFALIYQSELSKTVITILAPMGKIALTNYLLQSILMLLFLSGIGIGLADRGQFVIAEIAIAIFLVQLAFSHFILRYYKQGPMESLWRRYTHHNSNHGSL